MELFLLHKSRYAQWFRNEEAFFYPLALNTPLLQARFIGKPLSVKLQGHQKPLKGIFLGVIDETLYSYFYKHLGREALAVTTLVFGENEDDWLSRHVSAGKPLEGIAHVSNPREPPFFVVLASEGDYLVFAAFSEQEQADLPQVNFNLVVTNEAIEKLKGFLKRQLPKPIKHKKKGAGAGRKDAAAAKQEHLKKFFGK